MMMIVTITDLIQKMDTFSKSAPSKIPKATFIFVAPKSVLTSVIFVQKMHGK